MPNRNELRRRAAQRSRERRGHEDMSLLDKLRAEAKREAEQRQERERIRRLYSAGPDTTGDAA